VISERNMKRIKRKIASLLTGTMIVTQLATLPAWAATTTHIKFNFTDLNPSIKNIVSNVDITGGASNTLIDDGSGNFHGMVVDTSNHFVYLPFVNPVTGNPNGGTFDNTKILDGKTWDVMGLDGYVINSWSSAKENGFDLWRMDSVNFPQTERTYYAKLGADPLKTYDLKVKYKSATGVYVPGIPADTTTSQHVLDSIPQSPIIPEGFKITNTNVDDTVKFFDHGTTTAFTGFNASAAGFSMDADFNVSGTMVNKDTNITFNYEVNRDIKKTLQVVDEIYQDNALTTLSKRMNRAGGTYTEYALFDVETKNINPNQNLLDASSGAARYILKEVKINYIDSERNIAAGNAAANDTLLTNDITTAAGTYTRINANPVNAATDPGKIKGNMPNQDVKVTYKYYINPTFETTLRVKYVDDRGNDITDKIVSGLENGTAYPTSSTGLNNGDIYKEVDGAGKAIYLDIKAGYNAGQYDIHIPVPEVPNYRYGATDHPKAQLNGGTATWGSSYQTAIASIDSSWTSANPFFDLTTVATGPIESKEIVVTYSVDPTAVVQLIPINGAGGSIRVANNPSAATYDVNTDTAINLSRINTVGSSTYDVNIDPSDMIYYPVPNAGYKFDHWETGADLGTQRVNLNIGTTQTLTGIPNSKNSITLKAVFEKEPNKFNHYHFNIGSHISPLPLGQDAEIANVDASGNPVALTFGSLSAYTAVTSDAGYTIQWYDGTFNPIDATTPINSLNGQTFTAFAQPVSALAANTPVSSGQLHPGNATPSIQIDPSTIDTRLRYVVVDPATGNVVCETNGANLVSTGGEINDPALTPGQNYQVYTALPTAVISVGNPIPGTDVSAPASATIPTTVNPLVEVDPNNRGKAKITIAPLSANTDYALIGPGGVVYPFTTPTGSDLVFDNLDPDVNFQIVARPTGTNTDPLTRQADTVPTVVSTANLAIRNSNNDITLISDATPQYSFLRFNGNNVTGANPLQGVAEGTHVEIKAAPLDNNSNIFQAWNVVRGIRNYTILGDRISFNMPNVPVTIQSVFASPTGNTWAKDYIDNLNSNQDVGVIYPMVNDSGEFRIQIIKSSMPTATRNEIAAETDDSFRPVFLITFNIQKKNPATGIWENYTDPSGANISFDVNIETGALLSNRNYAFYELGGSFASPSNAGSSVINLYTGVDFTSTSYTGDFTLTVLNGSTYGFGYTLPDDVKTVIVRDARDNRLVSTLHIASTKVIEDYSALYTANLTREYVDNNGITWHYEGISDDRNSFVPTDTTARVLADATVYLYFSNDRADRSKAVDDLEKLIQKANIELPGVANKDMLQTAIDAARAVLAQINRKASTAELKAAYDALELALKNAGKKSSDNPSPSAPSNSNRGSSGRGGSGSGGSGGGRSKSNSLSTTAPVVVGSSGNWELINPEEASSNLDNSKWIFKLNNGERVKGWQKLSYTYEGKTKEEWYHFEEDGIMNSGWFLDKNTDKWYYLSMDHNGFFGEMVKGWHYDSQDARWYFLDKNDGHMFISWNKIDGKWYFFNPTPPAQTWFFDSVTGHWNYGEKGVRSLGSMYINESTPDGYNVNAEGVWQ